MERGHVEGRGRRRGGAAGDRRRRVAATCPRMATTPRAPARRRWREPAIGRPRSRLQALDQVEQLAVEHVGLLELVVVGDLHGLGGGVDDVRPGVLDLVVEVPRLAADAARPHLDDGVGAHLERRAVVDGGVREDEGEVALRLGDGLLGEEPHAAMLQVREEEGVVDVAHAVDVVEAHLDGDAEAGHQRAPPAPPRLGRARPPDSTAVCTLTARSCSSSEERLGRGHSMAWTGPAPSPALRGTRWTCTCWTSWPASGPLLMATVQSLVPVARARMGASRATASMRAWRSSGAASSSLAAWRLGTTRAWPSARGLMSRKAMTRPSS